MILLVEDVHRDPAGLALLCSTHAGPTGSGWCSPHARSPNLRAAADRQATHGTSTSMATGRLAHDQQVPPTPRGRIPKDATLKQRMARKLRTKPGRAAYARRKAIVEIVDTGHHWPAGQRPGHGLATS